jgi:hypothetical protein
MCSSPLKILWCTCRWPIKIHSTTLLTFCFVSSPSLSSFKLVHAEYYRWKRKQSRGWFRIFWREGWLSKINFNNATFNLVLYMHRHCTTNMLTLNTIHCTTHNTVTRELEHEETIWTDFSGTLLERSLDATDLARFEIGWSSIEVCVWGRYDCKLWIRDTIWNYYALCYC